MATTLKKDDADVKIVISSLARNKKAGRAHEALAKKTTKIETQCRWITLQLGMHFEHHNCKKTKKSEKKINTGIQEV